MCPPGYHYSGFDVTYAFGHSTVMYGYDRLYIMGVKFYHVITIHIYLYVQIDRQIDI